MPFNHLCWLISDSANRLHSLTRAAEICSVSSVEPILVYFKDYTVEIEDGIDMNNHPSLISELIKHPKRKKKKKK